MGPLPRGQRGARYILAILHVLSKYIQLYPIKKATTETILRKITTEFIPKIGPIEQLLTDNGTQFHSKKWFRQTKTLGIQLRHTTTYHLESNPVERANREIWRMLRTYCHAKHTNWVRWLPNIKYWINNSHHQSTGHTPAHVIFGQEYCIHITDAIQFSDHDHTTDSEPIIEMIKKKLKSKAEARNKSKDQGKKFKQYQVGQQVLMREHRLSSAEDSEIHKFFLLYKGLYTIIKTSNNNIVLLEDQGNQVTLCNVKNIKPYYTMATTVDKSLCCPPDPRITSDHPSSHPN